ncbi:MAG: peptide ABC transporter substrate-binding protein [Chloroflexia bacterium]
MERRAAHHCGGLSFHLVTVANADYGASSQLRWDRIASIDLSNNNLTATIKLKEVCAPFFATTIAGSGATTSGFMLPMHKFEGMQPAQIGKSDYGTQGSAGHVSSGPFKIESWRKGEAIRLVRNDNYVGQKSCLDGLIFQVVPSVDAGTSALQRGDVDLATNYYASDIPTLKNLEGRGIKTLAYPAYLVERYVFNYNDPKDPNITVDPTKARPHPVMSDAAVRRAISLGINRPAIVEKLLYNNAKIAVNEWDNSPWFNTAIKPYPYDPEAAKKMLDDAGWVVGDGGIRAKGGVRLSFTHSTTSGNPIRETIQRAAINDLRNIGIEMKILNHDPSKLFATFSEGGVLSRRNFDIGGYTTGIGLDPDFSSYYACSQIPHKGAPAGSNFGGYCNPELDKLWAAQAKEPDPAKRKAIYDQIQQVMYDDTPILWIYDRLQIDAAGPNFTAPKPDFTGYIWWAPEQMTLKGGQ